MPGHPCQEAELGCDPAVLPQPRALSRRLHTNRNGLLILSRTGHLERLQQLLLQKGSCSAWLVPGTQKLHLGPSAFCGQVSSP